MGKKERHTMSTPYYTIDEATAKLSHDMMSMSDYVSGSKTAEYRAYVDRAAALAAREKDRKPEYAEAIDGLLDRYARKLADWINTESRIGAMCPSVMISGGSNFPVRKKEKQNVRMDAHMKKYAEIEKIVDRIKSIGTGGISASDANALVKLETKLEKLKELQERMKRVNVYFRKNKTLDGCDLLTEEQIEKITENMSRFHCIIPIAPYELSCNNAEIHRIEKRIEEIKSIKAAGDTSVEVEDVDGLKIVEDTSLMRIQLVFDGKPDEEVRSILKANGFRWAPSQQAWQRQLNANGKYAARRAISEIRKIQGA